MDKRISISILITVFIVALGFGGYKHYNSNKYKEELNWIYVMLKKSMRFLLKIRI